MPCYQVQTVSVRFNVAHVNLLLKAAKELGWNAQRNDPTQVVVFPSRSYSAITINLDTGMAALDMNQQSRLNELRQAYSQQAVMLAARLGGWRQQSTAKNKGLLIRGIV